MRALVLLALVAATVHAEERPAAPLTLDQAVEFALAHHPALAVDVATEEARRALVSVARSGYLPSVDLALELNAGTGNVLRGSLLPMNGIPAVSGPPTGRSFSDASLGTVIGVGARWDALGLIYVDRVRDGAIEQVTVQRGTALKDRVEVFGQLQPGDAILKRGSEELKDGAKVKTKPFVPDGGAK